MTTETAVSDTSCDSVTIVEVSPRDGLQNEKTVLPTPAKAQLVRELAHAGLRRIEVTSFVHPRLVPQLADAEQLAQHLGHHEGASFIGLVLNERGAHRALATDEIDEINYVVPVTDAFGQANQGVTTAGALAAGSRIAELARSGGRRFSITLAVAFGCPYEGEVSEHRLADVASRAAQLEPDELGLADTIGCAVPAQVRRRIKQTYGTWHGPLRMHFHETRRTGLANADAALESGVRILDSSAGGIGGCPFAPGAAGNVATEDLLWMLQRSGIQITEPIDVTSIAEIGSKTCAALGFQPRSAIGSAGVFPATSRG
jgi:hydroxymethylglutaryl-CoA lyase